MARFVPRQAQAGEAILREGEAGGGLFLVVLGEVEVVKRTDTGPILLAKLGEGAYFGEISLLRGTPVSATARAAMPLEPARLPPRDFYALSAEYPVLWEEVRREAQRRELANQTILAGETPMV